MSVFVIVNPLAGFGRSLKFVKVIKNVLKSLGFRYKFRILKRFQRASDVILSIGDNFKYIIVVGGDGTVKSVVEGIFLAKKNFIIVPFLGGTGGELSRYLGIMSVSDLKDALTFSNVCEIDVFRASIKLLNGFSADHFFVANLQIGHFSQSIKETPNLMKKIFGVNGYMVGVFKAIFRRVNKNCLVRCDGEEIYSGKIYTIHLGNMKTTRGGVPVTPLASPIDGKVDILLGKRIGRLEAVKILPKVLRGEHLNHPAVIYRQAKNVSIICDGEHIAIDGEYLGLVKNVEVNYAGKIKVLCGRKICNC